MFSSLSDRLNALRARYLPHGSLRHAMVSGSLWSIIGAIASRSFTLVATIIIARFLGKAGFGRWGLIVTTVSMYAQFASFGVALTATKHVAELRETDPNKAGRILSFILIIALTSLTIMALVCIGASKWMAYRMYKIPELYIPFLFSSILLFCMVGTQMIKGVLAGFEDFRTIARINMFQGVVIIIVIVPLLWGYKIIGAVIAMSASQATALILCCYYSYKNTKKYNIPLRIKGVWSERSILWQYSIPALMGGAVSGPAMSISQAIVARIPGGVSGLGGFMAAVQWREIVLFIPGAIRRITLPILSRLKGDENRSRYIRALWANIGLNGSVALIGSIPVMILSPWILSFYGKNFSDDWAMMVVLVGSSVFMAIKNVLSQVTVSFGKIWWNLRMAIIWSGVVVGGTAYMVPRYGVWGYVWVIASAAIVNVAMYSFAAYLVIKKYSK